MGEVVGGVVGGGVCCVVGGGVGSVVGGGVGVGSTGSVPLLTSIETSGSLYIEYPSHLGNVCVRKYIEEVMSKPVDDLPASDW